MLFSPNIHIKYRIHNAVELIWSMDWLLSFDKRRLSEREYARLWKLFRETKKKNLDFLRKELKAKLVPKEFIRDLIEYTQNLNKILLKKQDEKAFEIEARPIFEKALPPLIQYKEYLAEYRSDYLDD